ncbi:Helix-turn-helix domain-containing protein [Ruminococcus sp. YE71]|uniref:helix-turn-helix domain-containing protein n=1 Tax=unclassified Ruminococcus TaxID=2608920 RepID=UPI00088B7CD2|nr:MULTISPECIES: helix-turn-helix domain-containing protein [unclassified Ruminococcus]SDA26605.1 Helix-turn-helix domain-containing protein [Ruminococcus sp. YE78]SFW44293.1 Helix-turn-helix domain-containing protein [Ruminococcus sp. YE71]
MSKRQKVLIADTDSTRAAKLSRLPIWAESGFIAEQFSADIPDTIKNAKSGCELIICRHDPSALPAPELMKAVAASGNTPLFIVMSRTADASLIRECFILGAVDFLTEPIDEQKLSDAVLRARSQLKRNTSNEEYVSTANDFFEELGLTENNDKFITQLRKFMLSSENVIATTEYAADHFGFNKDYFGRMFKSKLGMTFGDFYNRFRMKFAERLLRSGRYKVYEVSEMLGFASVDYFSAVFKKTTGKRPSDVKKY